MVASFVNPPRPVIRSNLMAVCDTISKLTYIEVVELATALNNAMSRPKTDETVARSIVEAAAKLATPEKDVSACPTPR